jgi:hypothetical protein
MAMQTARGFVLRNHQLAERGRAAFLLSESPSSDAERSESSKDQAGRIVLLETVFSRTKNTISNSPVGSVLKMLIF